MASVEEVHPVEIRCEKPWRSNAMEISEARVPMVPEGMAYTEACLTAPRYQSSYIRSLNSMAPPPEPSITPMLRLVSRSSVDGSIFASARASCAAAIAIGTTRETCFMSLADTQGAGSKSTSPATRHGSEDGSNCEMVRMPLLPDARAEKYCSRPTPFGLSTPRPVMTMRSFLAAGGANVVSCASHPFGDAFYYLR